MVDTALADRDIWGLWRDADAGVLLFLPVRAGMMLEPVGFPFSKSLQGDAEIVSSGLLQFYSSHALPREVLIPFSLPEQPVLEELLSAQRNGAFRLHVPKRGSKARLVELANQNAEARYRQRENKKERLAMALESLAKKCGLVGPPRRIECFDNSNFQGHSPVASQVVFLNGVPAKKLYRRYHIRGVEGPDDYASMEEVLGRRIRRAWLEDDFPDLIVVDGGVGQLSAALKVLKNHGSRIGGRWLGQGVLKSAEVRWSGDEFDSGAIGALDFERHRPGSQSLAPPERRIASFCGVFPSKNEKASLYSELDAIQGQTDAKKALLKHFGEPESIREASSTDIAALKGFSSDLAQRIVSGLKRPD